MIRIGQSSSFSSNLNNFHNTSTQSTGFWTNAAIGGLPPSGQKAAAGVDRVLTPGETQTALSGAIFFVGHWQNTPGALATPFTVSNTVFQVNAVSNGFTVQKSLASSGTVRYIPVPEVDVQVGRPLEYGEFLYLQVDSVLPSPHTYSFYAGNSGSVPRDVLVYESSVLQFDAPSKTLSAINGGAFSLFTLLVNASGVSVVQNSSVSTATGSNNTYSPWTGSALGIGFSGVRLVVGVQSE